MGLTFVIAGGKHSLICRTGANVPYLPSLVQKDILINDVILIIKVNDVNLQEKREQRGEMLRMKLRQQHGAQCTPRRTGNTSGTLYHPRCLIELELPDMNNGRRKMYFDHVI